MQLNIRLCFLLASLSLAALANPLRNNGCRREDNKIVIIGFSSGKCEQSPCVDTGKATLEEVTFSGCNNVTCTNGPPTLSKRAGQVVATLPSGAHGTCSLPSQTQSIFSCSDEKKIIVTVDIKGLLSFISQGEEEEAPSAYFSSSIDKDGCFEPKLQDQSNVMDEMLHIDCEGDTQRRCLYHHSST